MPGLQEWIYKLEEGGGTKIIRAAAAVLVFAGLAVFHDLRKYKNFHSEEAMDQAQIARNIAQGKGYTTHFIRPLSIFLLQQKDPQSDGRLHLNHPDLANPPVYPAVLAGLMKALSVDFSLPTLAELGPRPFSRYQPEVIITIFNQVLFLGAVVMLFFIARRLFDSSVAWVSAVLFGGAEVFWRFSMSGLSTMLILVLFLGMVMLLLRAEEDGRAEEPGPVWRLPVLALAIGLTIGILGMTRYSFAWLIIPAGVFLGVFIPRQRAVVVLVAVVTFAGVMTPWLLRNYSLSGHPFGTTGYVMAQATLPIPKDRLPRLMDPRPDMTKVGPNDYGRKLIANTRTILQTELPRLGGVWIGAFFLVGVLIPFRSPGLSRLRLFLIMTLVVLLPVQALGQTHLASETPEINSENLLVVLTPLVIIFGVALFFMLLEQIAVPIPQLRMLIGVFFVMLMCSPLLASLLQPRTHPMAWPPYLPPLVYQSAGWMTEREIIMSDVPWAVAWYGSRQSVWLTVNRTDQFYKLHDEVRSIHALYLTERTMEAALLSDIILDNEGWGRLLLEVLMRREAPNFPLRVAAPDFLPRQMFLTDWRRWQAPVP